tara:strand:+ start:3312 stop:3608 length:297 start_codon:yes stop_codon:yes gene_type:complete
MKVKTYEYFLEKQFKNWNPDKYDWDFADDLLLHCRQWTPIWKEDYKRMEAISKLSEDSSQMKPFHFSYELDEPDEDYIEETLDDLIVINVRVSRWINN